MIDLHSHILPGVDDGASSVEQALEMARLAVEDGIRVLTVTPHHMNGRYTNPAKDVQEALALLRIQLQEAGIPLELIAGQEIRLTDQFWQEWEAGKLLTLGGSRYVLIELPWDHIPRGFAEFIHEMAVSGHVPIIAHPERHAELAEYPNKLAEFIELGAWAQVTTHSLLGLFGSSVRKTAQYMSKSKLIHIVASDAHDGVKRGFGMREAYARIEREFDRETVRYYQYNAQAVYENAAIEIRQPSITSRKKWLGIW